MHNNFKFLNEKRRVCFDLRINNARFIKINNPNVKTIIVVILSLLQNN